MESKKKQVQETKSLKDQSVDQSEYHQQQRPRKVLRNDDEGYHSFIRSDGTKSSTKVTGILRSTTELRANSTFCEKDQNWQQKKEMNIDSEQSQDHQEIKQDNQIFQHRHDYEQHAPNKRIRMSVSWESTNFPKMEESSDRTHNYFSDDNASSPEDTTLQNQQNKIKPNSDMISKDEKSFKESMPASKALTMVNTSPSSDPSTFRSSPSFSSNEFHFPYPCIPSPQVPPAPPCTPNSEYQDNDVYDTQTAHTNKNYYHNSSSDSVYPTSSSTASTTPPVPLTQQEQDQFQDMITPLSTGSSHKETSHSQYYQHEQNFPHHHTNAPLYNTSTGTRTQNQAGTSANKNSNSSMHGRNCNTQNRNDHEDFSEWAVGDRYQLLRILGRGSYGEVAQAKYLRRPIQNFTHHHQQQQPIHVDSSFPHVSKSNSPNHNTSIHSQNNSNALAGTDVAIKRITSAFDQEVDAIRIYREMHILRRLRGHSCIIQLLDIIPPADFESFNDLYLVFECKSILSNGYILYSFFLLLTIWDSLILLSVFNSNRC